VNRRELLSKIGLAALLPVAAVSGMAIEPETPEGEWYLNGMPICPECGMCMDQRRLRAENGGILIQHPDTFYIGDEQRKWPCKNAGKTFTVPTVSLAEYHGKVSERGGFPMAR
jgi:hypothetical protein